MKKKSNPSPVAPGDIRTVPLHQEIATQAYILWNHYGQPAGRDLDVWLEAERQVLGVDGRISAQPGGAVDAKNLQAAITGAALSSPPPQVRLSPAPPR